MKKTKIEVLKQNYERACDDYVVAFCVKQEMGFEFWVGDDIGGIAMIGDYFFNMHDMVWDVNSEQPAGLILSWYEECIEHPKKAINYFSYTKGLRAKDIKQ